MSLGLSLTNVGRQLTGYFEGDERRASLPGALRAGIAKLDELKAAGSAGTRINYIRSGSRSMISSALITDATEAGGGAAEKISDRALCFT
mgnify:CR=1 FL=1